MNTILVGARIRTQHGEGVVIGFEAFSPQGDVAPMHLKDNKRGRILVTLDPGHSWAFQDSTYAVFRHQLKNGEAEILEEGGNHGH